MGDSNTIDATKRREVYAGTPEDPDEWPTTTNAGRNVVEDEPLKMYRWIVGDDCNKTGNDHDYDACVNKKAPTVSGAGHEAELFVKEGKDTEGVEPGDVMQRQLGDCYLMAALAGLAATPEGRAVIHGALRENKDPAGNIVSYSVKLFDTEHHLLEAATVVAKWIDVPADEPYVTGHAQARTDGVHEELWPLLIEKAYAQLRGSYNHMAKGGNPADAIKALTGKSVSTMEATAVTAQQIKEALDAHKIVVLTTRPDLSPIGRTCDANEIKPDNQSCIVPDHAYAVESVEASGHGEVTLHLRNPWGNDKTQPPPFRFGDLPKSFAYVEVGSP